MDCHCAICHSDVEYVRKNFRTSGEIHLEAYEVEIFEDVIRGGLKNDFPCGDF